MKKILLGAAIVAAFFQTSQVVAQCTPDPLYADSTFGVWPDTTTNFPAGQLNMPYETVLDLKVPTTGTDIDPSLPALPVDRIEITNVQNMPPGLSWDCNTPNCSWDAQEQGCVRIFGTPTTAGTYVLEISANGYSTTLPTIPVPYTFDGYRITVNDPDGLFDRASEQGALSLEQNQPNPAAETTLIRWHAQKAGTTQLTLYNMLGMPVYTRQLRAEQGVNVLVVNTTELANGMYVYAVSDGTSTATKRMTISHD